MYSSDLKRTLQTVAPFLAQNDLPLFTDLRLREWHLGVLEGMLMDDAITRYPEVFEQYRNLFPEVSIPEGESIHAFSERVIAAFGDIAASGARRVLVSTHGGVISILLNQARNEDKLRKYRVANASLTTFHVRGSTFKLVSGSHKLHIVE